MTMPNSILRILALFLLAVASPSLLFSQNTLKDIASDKKVYIGNLISNGHLDNPTTFRGGLAEAHLTSEYDAVVLENYMKMSFVLPGSEPANIHDLTVEQLKDRLTQNNIERFLSRPEWDGLRKRGHAMIWFSQAPGWLNASGPDWTGQQVFDFSRKYILALGQICGDRVDEWDVINEAISDQSPGGQREWRPGTWYRRANDGSMTDWGEATYENYIKMLFVWAREAQPYARLYYNDYSIENFSNAVSSKNRFMRDKFKALKTCGAPIDGIGFQSHFILSDMVSSSGILNQGFINSVENSMENLDAAGMDVVLTELDIRICNANREEAFQEVAFRAITEMALTQPNCREILVWGLRDEDHWITLSNSPPFNGCQDAVLAEGADYSPKAAYDGVAAALTNLPDREEYGFADLVAGNGSPADCGGEGSVERSIVSIDAPGVVSRGDTAYVDIVYNAGDDQQVVMWFQLDEAPYTTYAEFRVNVPTGTGELTAKMVIPGNVPIAMDDYQFQTILVPTGGGWEQRISNKDFRNVDVVMGTGVDDGSFGGLALRAYPNPTAGIVNVELPAGSSTTNYAVFDLTGRQILQGESGAGTTESQLDLSEFPAGLYVIRFQRNGDSGRILIRRR